MIPPQVAQQHFLSLVEKKYKHHHHIYTDGSVEDGTVGFGIFNKPIDFKSSLPPSCSIFSAEAHALLTASSFNPPQPNQQTVIFSDSASCLEDMKSSVTSHPWILSAEKTALDKGFSFCWIPAHKGIEGNEKADQLAKAGRLCDVEPIPIPAKDAVRWSKNSIRESWDSSWFRNRDPFLRRIKPSTPIWPDNPDPKSRRILSRLRIGHTRLTHSYRLDKTVPPTCPTCNLPLTVSHILTECLAYQNERSANGLDTALELVLSPPYEKQLIQFLKDTHLHDQI